MMGKRAQLLEDIAEEVMNLTDTIKRMEERGDKTTRDNLVTLMSWIGKQVFEMTEIGFCSDGEDMHCEGCKCMTLQE